MSRTGRVATRLATIRARFVWCRMYAVWLGMTRPERTSTLLYLYYPFLLFRSSCAAARAKFLATSTRPGRGNVQRAPLEKLVRMTFSPDHADDPFAFFSAYIAIYFFAIVVSFENQRRPNESGTHH